ncbi:MAG TPA: class I SAM-dependent methyltransferase [Anaerolineales bacterium]|nr:class I SAM-dependent methyltransferase [Anaerolineales bacterium]
MPEIVNHCPLCGSDTNSSFDQREFRGIAVSNVICGSCGLVYQSPRMTVAESQSFYEAEYRRLYQGQEGPNATDLAVQTKRARSTLEFASPFISTCARVLDIGCSSGILLQQFRDHYQSQVIGIEPGNSYRQYALASGLEVFSSLEEVEQQGRLSFNLVCMMHVLEHLAEPVEYLQNLRTRHLASDGWLLLEVPNLYAHDCFEVAHLVSFSPHTLTQVLQKAGYRVVRLHIHGQPRSKIIPLYITLLARPEANIQYTQKPDRLVRNKRQTGFLYRRFVTRLFPHQAWLSPG